MALTQTSLCNLALSLIGNEQNQITDFDNDTGKNARQCRLHYDPTLSEITRMHPWGCAKDRSKLIETVPSITDSSDVDFTYNATLNTKAEFRPVADDQSIRWNSTSSEWEYGTWSSPTFTATFTNTSQEDVPPESGWEAVTTGTLTLTKNYDFGWDYAFLIPSTCIRALGVKDSTATEYFLRYSSEWTLENRIILTNSRPLYLLYVKEPTAAEMDSLFALSFYTLLASKLAVPITGDLQMARGLKDSFNSEIMPEARRVSSLEKRSDPVLDSGWMEATLQRGYGTKYSFNENSDGSIVT